VRGLWRTGVRSARYPLTFTLKMPVSRLIAPIPDPSSRSPWPALGSASAICNRAACPRRRTAKKTGRLAECDVRSKQMGETPIADVDRDRTAGYLARISDNGTASRNSDRMTQ
jgi:hypothetical protein